MLSHKCWYFSTLSDSAVFLALVIVNGGDQNQTVFSRRFDKLRSILDQASSHEIEQPDSLRVHG